MSVFTPVSRETLEPWLAAHGIRELRRFDGISGGTINTNYWLETEAGDWILTLVEDRSAAAVAPVMALMQALSEASLPVPGVRPDREGNLVGRLQNRPATLVQALPGRHPAPEPSACAEVGRFLARLHRQSPRLPPLPLNFGPQWQQACAERWIERLPAEEAALMRRTLASIGPLWRQEWPEAWVHADLFPDNVLATDDRFTAVIDWYFASRGPRIWDLAIALNAWCGAADPGINPSAAALLEGYESVQALAPAEREGLPAMRRSAALRFWLSRLEAAERHAELDPAHAVTIKPPAEYCELLLELEQMQH